MVLETMPVQSGQRIHYLFIIHILWQYSSNGFFGDQNMVIKIFVLKGFLWCSLELSHKNLYCFLKIIIFCMCKNGAIELGMLIKKEKSVKL